MDLIIIMPAADSPSDIAGLNYADEMLPGTRVRNGKKLVMVNTDLNHSQIKALYPTGWRTALAQGERSRACRFNGVVVGRHPRIIKTRPLLSLREFAADNPDGSRPTVSDILDVLRFKFQGHERPRSMRAWAIQAICQMNTDGNPDDFEVDGTPKLARAIELTSDELTQSRMLEAWDKIKLKLGN